MRLNAMEMINHAVSFKTLEKWEDEPFFKVEDARYNNAIESLKWLHRTRMYALERERQLRNLARQHNEIVNWNKPKMKHLMKSWQTIKSCEYFFKLAYNDQKENA